MKIRLVILIIVVVLPIYGQEKSPKPSGNESHTQNTNKPDAIKSPASPNAGVVINQETTSCQCDRPKENSKSYLSRLFAPENLPNIGLLFAGIGGIVIAICTLRKIERQTKGIEDSIKLQKTLKRQWVNLENWNIKGEPSLFSKKGFLDLNFHVVNPTEMVMQLKHVEIFDIEGNQVLSPNTPLAPTKFQTAAFRVNLTENETNRYFDNSLNLHIFGNIAFRDNFGDRQNQVFGYVCMGGIKGFQFRAFDRWLSQEEDDE